MSAQEIDAEVAVWAGEVAAALAAVGSLKTSYGEFYVSDARISFDGDPTGYSVVANEHAGYNVRIEGGAS